ncbi:cysteine peptidase family C39 domain-containing protein [Paenibacillus sp. WLX2291]|uniref:cysteine peptidase family C39 domain-containing protein n=1 Tax=Paenibacillus sp. WLX2291 TaxID=3296934 RepID=UPI003983FE06
MNRQIIHIRQLSKNDCAIACISSILSYYGIHYSYDAINDYVFSDYLGTKASDIVTGFEKLNFNCKVLE